MSELTRCNYCTLEQVRRDNPGAKVTVDQPVDPKMEDFKQVFIDGKPQGIWFNKVSAGCVC